MNRPRYSVFLVPKNKDVGEKRSYTKVGVGWEKFDGEVISLSLNPGVVLDWRICKEFYISVKEDYPESYYRDTRPNNHGSRNGEPPF